MRPSRYAFPAALLCAAGLSIELCFCVITSNTTFSCSSVSTCVLLRGFSKYFPTISAISFGVTPKSAATSFTRYFTKLIFSPPPD